MDKDTSEIAKLTERISKDPKSKLFVPLAEEYKKSGDSEMAIHVLTEGLKNNPGYITARSILGRLLYDRGDLAGAQHEFEEVVKTIPDNLMAQRKLGDTYVHQGRTGDAIKHYKAALSLNSKDAELAALVSELEAGRDGKGMVPKPGTLPPQEEQAAPKGPQAGGEQLQVKPAPTPVPAAKQKLPDAKNVTSMGLEIPEEVIEVEPLEPEAPKGFEPQRAPDGLEFLAETGQETAPISRLDSELPEAAFGEEEPFPFKFPSHPAAKTPAVAVISPSGPEPEATSFAEEEQKASDDFTTDTLAELYIAQGFYEKAIDIYERMLADRPTNQRLKEKLAQVRAMAGEAAPVEEPKEASGPSSLYEEVPPEFEKQGLGSGRADSGFGEFIPPETEAFEQAASFDADFKAREYVPPSLGKEELAEPPAPMPSIEESFKAVEYVLPIEARPPVGEARQVSKPRPAAAGRKETIDRLESWLKQIAKEK